MSRHGGWLFDKGADCEESTHAVPDQNSARHVICTKYRQVVINHLTGTDSLAANITTTVTSLIEGDDTKAATNEVFGNHVPAVHIEGEPVCQHDGSSGPHGDGAELSPVVGGDNALDG
jgi:hypothetical protein